MRLAIKRVQSVGDQTAFLVLGKVGFVLCSVVSVTYKSMQEHLETAEYND